MATVCQRERHQAERSLSRTHGRLALMHPVENSLGPGLQQQSKRSLVERLAIEGLTRLTNKTPSATEKPRHLRNGSGLSFRESPVLLCSIMTRLKKAGCAGCPEERQKSPGKSLSFHAPGNAILAARAFSRIAEACFQMNRSVPFPAMSSEASASFAGAANVRISISRPYLSKTSSKSQRLSSTGAPSSCDEA